MRGAGLSRGMSRTTSHISRNISGVERVERLSSSVPRAPHEEASQAVSTDSHPCHSTAASRGGAEGYRRTLAEMASSNSDPAPDRRSSHMRDPLRRSRDTSTSDAPSMAERGGHGRDGPTMLRDLTAATTAGGGGGGGTSRGLASIEREKTGGAKTGEEELPMEVPGRYERMRILGRGSFGAVTLVKDHRDSRLYAMKTLSCGDKPEERVAAMAEVRLLKSLKHPSILTLYDVFVSADGRLVCLTTTYCESGDLAKIIKHASKTKSMLGEKTVLGWFAQLCLGVHHVHEERKVLHRDIKPNNVFLMDSKKIIQLGDFGLAKVINEGDKDVKAEVGTPYYTSPEMCNNQPYGFPSDVWSLGVVLYELLALDVPFRSRDVVALVSQVIKAPPPPLPDVYSSEATALARWMLQKDPLRRPTLTQVVFASTGAPRLESKLLEPLSAWTQEVLACQPLRRHVSSFVKNYRPMNMAERQRRQDIRNLEAQVVSIAEAGGDEPQIPADVDSGCGTAPATTPEEAAASSGMDGNLPPTEIKLGEEPMGRGASGVAAPGDDARRAKIADGGNRQLGAKGQVGEGGHGDDAYAACARCCPATCACVAVSTGSTTCAVGVGNGVGNTTPGRRFGSPQQSKGTRHVMSWGTGGTPATATPDGDAGTGGSAPPCSSDNEYDRGRRRHSSPAESSRSEDTRQWRDFAPVDANESDDGSCGVAGRKRGRASETGHDGSAAAAGGCCVSGVNADSVNASGARQESKPSSTISPSTGSAGERQGTGGGSSSTIDDVASLVGCGGGSTLRPSVRGAAASPRQTPRVGTEDKVHVVDNSNKFVYTRGSGETVAVEGSLSRLHSPSCAFAAAARTAVGDGDGRRRGEVVSAGATPDMSLTSLRIGPHQAHRGDVVFVAVEAGRGQRGSGSGGGGRELVGLGVTPRAQRSPRTMASDTSKTAKRLSEALTFAAGGDSENATTEPRGHGGESAGSSAPRRACREASTTKTIAAPASSASPRCASSRSSVDDGRRKSSVRRVAEARTGVAVIGTSAHRSRGLSNGGVRSGAYTTPPPSGQLTIASTSKSKRKSAVGDRIQNKT